jgi:predicted DCC family thiol-disulfide oxidoreductase YuxK
VTQQILLIYDGECGFCRWGMHMIARLDHHGVFRYCPFGSAIAESYLAELPPTERYASFHAHREGVLHSATAAAKLTLEQLPFGRIAVALGWHNVYPLIAANRGRLGRLFPYRSVVNTCDDSERLPAAILR